MPLSPRISTLAATASASAVASLLDHGFLDLYDGIQPESPDVAVSNQRRLARLGFDSPAFAVASGIATANHIYPDRSAKSTGDATWFRTYRSDGTTPVFDGSVGTSDSNIMLNTTAIEKSSEVSVSGLVYSQSKE